MPAADTAKIEEFLAEPRNAMVAAIRNDGRPQVTPNWFHWDGERFYVSTTKTRKKYANYKRDSRAQLIVDDATGFKTVLVDATAEVIEDFDRMKEPWVAIKQKYRGETTEAEMREQFEREQRVMLAFTPDRPIAEWTAWGFS